MFERAKENADIICFALIFAFFVGWSIFVLSDPEQTRHEVSLEIRSRSMEEVVSELDACKAKLEEYQK